MCFRISFLAYVLEAVLNFLFEIHLNFVYLPIQKTGNLHMTPKLCLEILELFALFYVSELKIITIARIGKMERERKEWKEERQGGH